MIDRREFLRGVGAAAVTCCVPSCSDVRPAGGRNAAQSAALIRSGAGVLESTLVAAETRHTIAGRSARIFTFNGRLPGPRLEARPGDEIALRLENRLGEPTNLHFHGLHVPPDGRADNVFLEIPDGDSFDYRFTIPATHPAGLFWIHPHLHGLVARQVGHGLAAPFVIRGEIDELPEVAAAHEAIVVLQDFSLGRDGRPAEPSPPEVMHGREGAIVTASGSVNPRIPIRSGGLLRLRLLNASPSRFYRLKLEQHPMHLIGVDGGSLDSVRTSEELLFLPGERLDILVEGTRDGGDYRLLNLPYDRGMMGMGGTGGMGRGRGRGPMGGMSRRGDEVETLATIEYRGKAESSVSLPSSLPPTLAPLPPPDTRRTISLGMGMGMMGRGMTFTIDGREFDAARVDARPKLGTIEDWRYVNQTPMDHPMHLHTNLFQLVRPDGSLDPAWRDIILVPAGGEATFRVKFEDFAGKTVHHCHILDHEDLGMMATVMMTA